MKGARTVVRFTFPEGQEPSDKDARVYGKTGRRYVEYVLGQWAVVYERLIP